MEILYKYKDDYYIELCVEDHYSDGKCIQFVYTIFKVSKENIKKYLYNEISIYNLIKISNEIVLHYEELLNVDCIHSFYKIYFEKLKSLEYLPDEDTISVFDIKYLSKE